MADPIRPEQSHLSTKPLRSLWFLVRLGSQVSGHFALVFPQPSQNCTTGFALTGNDI
jgi:hypothetical protein